MKMRVTGGAGYTGSHACKALARINPYGAWKPMNEVNWSWYEY